MKSVIRHRLSLASLFAVLVAYLVAFALMPKDVFWSPDEGIKFIIVETLAGSNGSEYVLPYRGASLDAGYMFYPSNNPYPDNHNNYPYRAQDGSVHFPWPLWFPWLARIPFLVLGVNSIYLVPLLGGWLVGVASWGIMARLQRSLAPAAILVVGLGTPVFFYSLTFWEHTLATLLAMLALWIVMSAPAGRLVSALLVVPILVAAIILRIEMLAFALAFGLSWLGAVLVRRHLEQTGQADDNANLARSALPRLLLWDRWNFLGKARLLLWLAMAIGLLMAGIVLASEITPRHKVDAFTYWQATGDNVHKAIDSPERALVYFTRLPDILLNYAGKDGPTVDSLWIWGGMLALVLIVLSAFVRSARWQAVLLVPSLLVLLGASGVVLTSRESFRSIHGVFLLSPGAVLAIHVLPHAWHRREWPLLFATFTAVLYLGSGVAMILATRVGWDGSFVTGLEWGPRYMLPLFPLWMLLALVACKLYYESDRPLLLRRFVVVTGIAMIVVGVQYQVRGVWMLYNEKHVVAGWQAALERQGEEPIVTDIWWVPASVATYYSSHEMFVVFPENAAEWLSLAASHGVYSFTFVSQKPIGQTFGGAGVELVPQGSFELPGMIFSRLEIRPDTRVATSAKTD